MLAMKCTSARFDSHDADDVKLLISHLKLDQPRDIFQIIEDYYPQHLVPAKTQFFIEEIFGN